MHYAVISDVHSNLEALNAVMRDIKVRRKIDDILFLGDAVGYGPDPNECVKALKDNCMVLLAGNHDWAVLGLTDIDYFNDEARAAILWTKEALTEDNSRAIETFSIVRVIEKDSIFVVHATPKEPRAWHYLLTLYDAEVNFRYFDQRICITGHTHYPSVIERLPSGELVAYSKDVKFGKDRRYIINAGSVGQPRDKDPRACYAIVDDEGVEFIRVEYNVRKTQKKMHEAGLPLILIKRLEYGM